MKKVNVIAMVIVVFMVVNYSEAMNSILPQHQIKLSVADGEYDLERWKICSSRALHEHYCKNKKEHDEHQTLPKLSWITCKEMDLWSKCLDCAPGDQFNRYANGLSQEDRKSLMICVGEYDLVGDEKIKEYKLNDPCVTAQLVDWYFPQDIAINMKPKSDLEDVAHFFSNEFIQKNLSLAALSQSHTSSDIARFTDNGVVSRVSQGVDVGVYDGERYFWSVNLDGINWKMCCCKKIENMVYCMSSIEQSQSGNIVDLTNHKDCYLWVVQNGKVRGRLLLECKTNILDCMFSFDGRYMVVHSDDQIIITEIKWCKNKPVFVSVIINSIKGIKSLLFNNQMTRFVVVSYEETVGSITVGDLLGNIVGVLKVEAEFSDVLISSDDKKLSFFMREGQSPFRHEGQSFFMSCKFDEFCANEIGQERDPVIVELDKLSDQRKNIGDEGIMQCVCNPVNNALLAITGSGKIVHSSDAFDVASLKVCGLKKISAIMVLIKRLIIYSSDHKAWLILDRSKLPNVLLIVDAADGSTIYNRNLRACDAEGLGLSKDQKSVIIFCDKNHYVKKLLCDTDIEVLQWIKEKSTVLESLLLYRLYQKHKNNAQVTLYEQEPLYKAMQSLPSDKKCNIADVIKKDLSPHQIRDNSLSCNQTMKKIVAETECVVQ